MVLVVTANEENASDKKKKIKNGGLVPYSWKTGFATKNVNHKNKSAPLITSLFYVE